MRALLPMPLLPHHRLMRALPALLPFLHALSPPSLFLRRGGSFYIQSKVFNAKEVLLEDLRKQEAVAKVAAAGKSEDLR